MFGNYSKVLSRPTKRAGRNAWITKRAAHKVKLPEEQWFTQRLTHFDDANRATWQQRYWFNGTSWKQGRPVFIMIGGEGEANPIWMVEGAWIKWAQEFGAFTFMLEHRFYGQSYPTV